MSAEPESITSRVTSTEGEEGMEHKGTTVCRTMFLKNVISSYELVGILYRVSDNAPQLGAEWYAVW